MGRTVRVTLASSALADLEELQGYAREGVPEVGQRLTAEILARIERLIAHPLSGRMVPEFHVEHLREIIYPPFRIVSRNDKGKVRVVRIWRSERLLRMP